MPMGNSAIIATTKSARAIRVREHYRSITGQKPIVFFGFFRVISGNVDPEVAEVRWVSVAGLALAKLPTTSEEDCSQMQPELYSHFKISGNCWESPRYHITAPRHRHISTSPHHHTTTLPRYLFIIMSPPVYCASCAYDMVSWEHTSTK